MKVETTGKSDYSTLIEIWEDSVRATHDFLQEEDIVILKPLILEQYFDSVDLMCAKNEDGKILGFCGVLNGNIEMLFIAPESRGSGVGTFLTKYAIENLGVTKVDVNEQNLQALEFYKHLGFTVVSRSPLDGQGKPYPLLHMEQDKINKLR
ncbi:GNAT family N-acetyltransferase [Microbulbifer sp. SSSA007]|uniref:GNAT family N-acetyltransferase n=1 Tax=Microbulbifer sp. SSSA007 TaxID=3243379 RepID=UPI004039DB21